MMNTAVQQEGGALVQMELHTVYICLCGNTILELEVSLGWTLRFRRCLKQWRTDASPDLTPPHLPSLPFSQG